MNMDYEDDGVGLKMFRAFGVGVFIDLLLFALGFFVFKLKGWGLICVLIVIAGHLLISGWVMIFRQENMKDSDLDFLRFGLAAALFYLFFLF